MPARPIWFAVAESNPCRRLVICPDYFQPRPGDDVAATVGDPRAMRRYAAALRKDADKLAARAAWLARRADRVKFEGPAADDLRQEMLAARVEAERAGGELRAIANRLLSAAARIETDLADARRTAGAHG
ncbi:MAG TPA: hypothetical protein VFK89_04770 [Actinomycetota bacterium]|nr:hypothetical protein [Actinomycetota bacterium]